MDLTVSMLETGMRYEGFLLVRSADQREGKTGGKYLDMNLTDKTGEVNCKLWDGTVPPPPQGSVVKVRGLVQEYNGRKQLRIEKLQAERKAKAEAAADCRGLAVVVLIAVGSVKGEVVVCQSEMCSSEEAVVLLGDPVAELGLEGEGAELDRGLEVVPG